MLQISKIMKSLITISIAVYRGLTTYLLMILCGLTCFALYVISFGLLRSIIAEHVFPLFCRSILFLIGIKVVKPSKAALPDKPVVYMFNHNSFLDIFIVPTLGLKNTRFIISKRTKKILPLYLCNLAAGALFIPFKNESAERLKFFENTEEQLLKNDFSIICAPEGVHRFNNKINNFNKGVFHMATIGKRPICPLYFHIPKESNPLEGYSYMAGTVTVELMPLVDTSMWRAEDVKTNTENVRTLFQQKFMEKNK